MTRNAPLLTLLAVAVLGGGLVVTNYVATPTAQTLPAESAPAAAVPAAASGPATVPVPAAEVPSADSSGAYGYGDEAAAEPEAAVEPEPEAEAVAEPEPAAEPEEVAEPVEEAALPEDVAYAGWTEDRELSVAIAVTGDEAVAYVCDGADIEYWLRGTVTDGELDLSNADGTATLTGTATADGAEGTVEAGGEEWAFTADATEVEDAVAGGRDDVADVADRAGMDY